MSKIKILPSHEAQKIAAGEVIERPAHILKELLENAIDAGASQITIYIEQSGKQLIRVVDNGCGMSADDAVCCFLPHATSKITSLDDLYTVQSYGFRGEALASISAVSKVQLITRASDAQDEAIGCLVEYYDGNAQCVQPTACPVGTDIAVRELFYNMPVRKKFLKHDETEWNQLLSIVQAVSLVHTPIHFKLFHDTKLVLNAPAVSTPQDRIAQIWGNNVAQQLQPLNVENTEARMPSWLSFSGLISQPHFWRHGRQLMFFFVNNRWIKNQELGKALLKGYLNVLPPAKFPAAFIFLTVDQSFIDVNVHPKKEEVRFIKPATVDTHLSNAVKKTLEKRTENSLSFERIETPRPSLTHHEPTVFQSFIVPPEQPLNNQISTPINWDTIFTEAKITSPGTSNPVSIEVSEQKEVTQNPVIVTQQLIIPQQKQSFLCDYFSIIGQLFKTYIMIENGDELVIVDQHAAHERVLYEKYLKNFESKEGSTLLFPEIVQVTKNQLTLIMGVQDFFHQQGIVIEEFGEQSLVIKTSPPLIQQHDLKNLVLEIALFIEEHDHFDTIKFRKQLNEFTHSHMACKAAVKAGDQLTPIFMQQLITDLAAADNNFICVHGRPTIWTHSKSHIEKNFRRI
jgi:DNA mismatch repair protein MutL